MNNSTSFFSLIIPTYNRASIITETLKSVQEQTYKNYEVIIVDDGSNDDTDKIISTFLNNNNLTNFHYFYRENAERGAARNFGLSKATGEWISFLDSDDCIYENHFQKAYDFLKENPNANVFHSAYEYRDNNDVLINKIKYPKNSSLNKLILNGNIFSCFGMFIKKEITQELKFNESRDLSGSEDWLLWLKIAARYEILFQPEITGKLVQHNGRSVLSFNEQKLLSRKEILVRSLNNDSLFLKKYGKSIIKKIEAHMLTYISLHLILSNKKTRGINFFLKGIYINFFELFTKRTIAIIKHLIFR
jgi:glycosyltransferase involved in cell wall biosynthesis